MFSAASIWEVAIKASLGRRDACDQAEAELGARISGVERELVQVRIAVARAAPDTSRPQVAAVPYVSPMAFRLLFEPASQSVRVLVTDR
ncbi:hypothetical protein [Microbacterium sp. 18062]|uniref:hypothetical protein n=1 Tax=Microbacterium sp. 18062 TaxID=2681410 RepID=UPI00135BF27B|nr:hypothetical protein [Microbacterium sp. 18062]